MNYNKTDYEILYFLQEGGYNGSFRSCTIRTMTEELKYSESKIRLAINLFLKDKYVKEGTKQGQAKTYYITEKGAEKLKDLII